MGLGVVVIKYFLIGLVALKYLIVAYDSALILNKLLMVRAMSHADCCSPYYHV